MAPELSFIQREEYLVDDPMSGSYDASFDLDDSDETWTDDEMEVDGENGFKTFPPGEEGLLQSNAGGEAVFLKVWEQAKPGFVGFKLPAFWTNSQNMFRRGDTRRRRYRIQRQVDSWTRQLPTLVDAYLLAKQNGSLLTGENDPGVWSIQVLGFSGVQYVVPVIKSYLCYLETGLKHFSYTSESKNANETLIRHGYIGGSPDQPTIAFPLETFQIYRQTHRVCPRFSIDGLAKVLRYLHMAR
jgi:hypothetical protein